MSFSFLQTRCYFQIKRKKIATTLKAFSICLTSFHFICWQAKKFTLNKSTISPLAKKIKLKCHYKEAKELQKHSIKALLLSWMKILWKCFIFTITAEVKLLAWSVISEAERRIIFKIMCCSRTVVEVLFKAYLCTLGGRSARWTSFITLFTRSRGSLYNTRGSCCLACIRADYNTVTQCCQKIWPDCLSFFCSRWKPALLDFTTDPLWLPTPTNVKLITSLSAKGGFPQWATALLGWGTAQYCNLSRVSARRKANKPQNLILPS